MIHERRKKKGAQMGFPHTVRRGDSLWSLAGRYLGNYNRWPAIHDYHNLTVRKNGGGYRKLKAIANPDLIYVGQIVMVPGRGEHVPAGVNPTRKASPTATAIPLNVKVEYMDISMRYLPYVTPAFTMTAEISGRIAQQNLSPTRHRDNWELDLSAEHGTLSQTLRTQGHDEAFLELVGGMEMAYDPAGRMATIRPSLALQTGMGPYTFRLEMVGPNHFSQTLSLDTISGEFESQGRKVRFSADVSFKVDVIVHPGTLPGEPRRFKEPSRVPAAQKTGSRVFPTIKERVVGALPTKTELAGGGIFVVSIVLLSFASTAAITATGATAGGLVYHGVSEVPNIKRGPHRHVIHTHDSGRIY
jgi:hypothetical protein